METEDVEKGENSGVSDKLRSQFKELQSHFPYSLENDVLMANCAWEYAAQWNRDPEVSDSSVHTAVHSFPVPFLLWKCQTLW